MHERERQGGGSPLVMRQKIVGLFTWFSYDGDNRRAWFKKMARASALKGSGRLMRMRQPGNETSNENGMDEGRQSHETCHVCQL